MVALSFVSMYVLMYAMVDTLDHVHHNINQFYTAELMTAAMVIIESALMVAYVPAARAQSAHRRGCLVALGLCWTGIRKAAVGDRQFLRSMIPHHAGAILMCEQAALRDPEIRPAARADPRPRNARKVPS